MIIIVFGLPGSGKSYFAERLAIKINAGYVSSDILRKQLYKNPLYTESQKREIYDQMLQKMVDAIKGHESLVLDATFYKSDLRDVFIKKAQFLGEEIRFIEVKAEEAIIKERLSHEREHSDADYKVYKILEQKFEPFRGQCLTLHSTNKNIDIMLEKALLYLQ